jgi:hypothetical protein
MWRRRWHHKRWNMWVHPINIKRPEFGIFSHLYRDLLEDEDKFLGPFRRTSSNATVCHIWWQRKYENKTPTIGGRFHLKNDLQLF